MKELDTRSTEERTRDALEKIAGHLGTLSTAAIFGVIVLVLIWLKH